MCREMQGEKSNYKNCKKKYKLKKFKARKNINIGNRSINIQCVNATINGLANRKKINFQLILIIISNFSSKYAKHLIVPANQMWKYVSLY